MGQSILEVMKRKPKIREEELLSKAIDALKSTVDLSVVIAALETHAPHDKDYDALLRIGSDGYGAEFSAIIKSYITHDILGALVSELRRLKPRGLLVTHHVTANQADKLRRVEIPFFDTAGNAFLNAPPLYVFISGRRPKHEKPEDKPTRAFTPSGLKTLFALLCNPGLELQGYREIAAAADVSHGTVGWVMSDLENEGYLVDMGPRGRRLVNKGTLLKRWVESYPAQLRPKLLLSRYKSREQDWWTNVHLEQWGAFWGGEVAAAKLTEYLRPQTETIYTRTNLPELQAKFGLRQDRDGDVEILKAFWKFDYDSKGLNIVPPLLIYADLLASGDDRNIETAGIIYDAHLARLVGEAPTL
jgi:hypothetical protein